MDTKTYTNKDNRYDDILKKMTIPQLAVYSINILKNMQENSQGKSGETKSRIELRTMYQALKQIRFFDHTIKVHNSQYKVFKSNELLNPFIIGKDTLDKQYIHTEDNKEVEILAKKAQLENRFSKLCKYARNKVIEKTARGASKDEYAKIFVNEIYKKIIVSGKMEEFLNNNYKYYCQRSMTAKEFGELETTKLYQQIIDELPRKNKIDIKNAFTFSMLEYVHNELAMKKSQDMNKIIDIYAKEKTKGVPSFNLSIKPDARILGQNSTGIVIDIPNYVCPFKMHISKYQIMDAEKRNNIKLEKQFRPHPIEPTLPLKVSDYQINETQRLTNQGAIWYFYDGRDGYDNETRRLVANYMTNNLSQKHSYKQQEIRNNIKQIKEKEAKLKELENDINNKKQEAKRLKMQIQNMRDNIEKNLE